MWFKNLVVFQFEETPDIDEQALQQGLEKCRFRPCAPQEPETLGWTSPMTNNPDQLYHAVSKMYLMTARREERVLPASVVREALNQKVAEIEQEQEFKVGRKRKTEMREQLMFEMMPRAFTRSTQIQGMILPQQKLLVVDTSSSKKAEEWVSLLRRSVGTLPVTPIKTKRSLSGVLTGWLNGKVQLPSEVEPGDECELRSPDNSGAVVRCRRQDLTGAEIRSHLNAGKMLTRMAVEWKQSLSFVINDNAEIKRLRFSDTTVEQASADGAADDHSRFDASFALMGLELCRFLPALWEVFGGLEEE